MSEQEAGDTILQQLGRFCLPERASNLLPPRHKANGGLLLVEETSEPAGVGSRGAVSCLCSHPSAEPAGESLPGGQADPVRMGEGGGISGN